MRLEANDPEVHNLDRIMTGIKEYVLPLDVELTKIFE